MLGYLKFLGFNAKMKVKEFFTKENGEVNIVAIVVLIGIAIVLALTFKDEIKKLINTLFTQINTNAENAIKKD